MSAISEVLSSLGVSEDEEKQENEKSQDEAEAGDGKASVDALLSLQTQIEQLRS